MTRHKWDRLHIEVLRDFAALPSVIPDDCEVAASTLVVRGEHIPFEDTTGMTFSDAREYCTEWGYTLGKQHPSVEVWVKPISFALVQPFRVLTLYRDIPKAGVA